MRLLMRILVVLSAVWCTPLFAIQANISSSKPNHRASAITANGDDLWICGTEEMIEVSHDGGKTWESKHETKDGKVLSDITFVDAQTGFAVGSRGLLLATHDGNTWENQTSDLGSGVQKLIFADGKHGIAIISSGAKITEDGGSHWKHVRLPDDRITKEYPFFFAAALLPNGNGVLVLKHGPAQYYASQILATHNFGQNWKPIDIPHTTLHSFLATQNKLWAAGTEVIDRDRGDGGYAVPAIFYSTDGETWQPASRPPHPPSACTFQGCLISNQTVSLGWEKRAQLWTTSDTIPSKWAFARNNICGIKADLACLPATKTEHTVGEHAGSETAFAAPGPSIGGRKCSECNYPQVIVTEHSKGQVGLNVSFIVLKDGTVKDVQVSGSPDEIINTTIRNAVSKWLFEAEDGPEKQAETKISGKLTITAITKKDLPGSPR